LNIRDINEVRRTERYGVEPLVSEPSYFEVEIAIEKLKSYKSPPGADQSPTEIMQAGCNTLRSEIHKLINCLE
jgi:hypothetical protein